LQENLLLKPKILVRTANVTDFEAFEEIINKFLPGRYKPLHASPLFDWMEWKRPSKECMYGSIFFLYQLHVLIPWI
jgi:hypothetical protein